MFRFEPTANLEDFNQVPGLKEAWSNFINSLYELNLYGDPNDRDLSALDELKLWGRSDNDLRVFNPASMPVPEGSQPRSVTWSALPTSFDEKFNSTREKLAFLDARQPFLPGSSLITRIQDEYCEWVVRRNAQNKITEVIFTSEPPEYYDFLFRESDASRQLLVALYKRITGVNSITIDDLTDARGEYNWYNQYNNDFAVHMQQPNNTLGAQINIVSRSCIQRFNTLGRPITDALGLIQCAGYGNENRQSDPRIGHAINTLARESRLITIENPVGLYISDVDWSGWNTPDGTDPEAFLTVERGVGNADPSQTYIVRAIYSVPEEKGYTVSDIKIGGESIEFGAQIAAKISIRVTVIVSEPAQLPLARAIGCSRETPFVISDFAPRALAGLATLSRNFSGSSNIQTRR
jgi:hypothetical protein